MNRYFPWKFPLEISTKTQPASYITGYSEPVLKINYSSAFAKDKKRVQFPTRKKPIVKDYSKKNLIDTTEDKFANSPGLKHWADITEKTSTLSKFDIKKRMYRNKVFYFTTVHPLLYGPPLLPDSPICHNTRRCLTCPYCGY